MESHNSSVGSCEQEIIKLRSNSNSNRAFNIALHHIDKNLRHPILSFLDLSFCDRNDAHDHHENVYKLRSNFRDEKGFHAVNPSISHSYIGDQASCYLLLKSGFVVRYFNDRSGMEYSKLKDIKYQPGSVRSGVESNLGTDSYFAHISGYNTYQSSNPNSSNSKQYWRLKKKPEEVLKQKLRIDFIPMEKDIPDFHRIAVALQKMREFKLRFTSLEFAILYRKVKSCEARDYLLSKYVLQFLDVLEPESLLEILIKTRNTKRGYVSGLLFPYVKKMMNKNQAYKLRSLLGFRSYKNS